MSESSTMKRVQTMVARMKQDAEKYPLDQDYNKAYDVMANQILPMLMLMDREEDQQHFMDQVMGDIYKSFQ